MPTYNADMETWRALEQSWVNKAAHNPEEWALYRGDDTEALCLPRAGHQPYKKSANKWKLKVHTP